MIRPLWGTTITAITRTPSTLSAGSSRRRALVRSTRACLRHILVRCSARHQADAGAGVTETVLQFVLYEKFKAKLQEGRQHSSSSGTDVVVAAGGSKLVACMLTYPHEVRWAPSPPLSRRRWSELVCASSGQGRTRTTGCCIASGRLPWRKACGDCTAGSALIWCGCWLDTQLTTGSCESCPTARLCFSHSKRWSSCGNAPWRSLAVTISNDSPVQFMCYSSRVNQRGDGSTETASSQRWC